MPSLRPVAGAFVPGLRIVQAPHQSCGDRPDARSPVGGGARNKRATQGAARALSLANSRRRDGHRHDSRPHLPGALRRAERAKGNSGHTDSCWLLGVFRRVSTPPAPPVSLEHRYDVAACPCPTLVPGAPEQARITRSVCRGGSRAGDADPAHRSAGALPDRFGFQCCSRSAAGVSAGFHAQDSTKPKQFALHYYQRSPSNHNWLPARNRPGNLSSRRFRLIREFPCFPTSS